MLKQTVVLLVTAVLLAACAGDGVKNAPGMQAKGSWKNIGKIQESSIEVDYDTGSISQKGGLGYVTERQVVQHPLKANFLGMPKYKVSISDWEFNCSNRTYNIRGARFWNDKGTLLAQHKYPANDARATGIAYNTPSAALFDIACKGR
ncbi:hypothetical protein QDY71_03015 [Kingella negevensis]|uniref:Surface-adhesin protein E-like domain-containing protein n=1 Tax=Kingella negevensis TaxID=1522312 RepID=A0A238HG82_9NEIS|nr:surface-adhesin E family protein [Kingella negevensis]MDK4696749.1 hypothetical protein [Kingella negevensis]SNB76713.1 Uncharacterised protein [Kingella negevensis]